MELGEKLRQARLEAGLSQRQLCEQIITRNMLSLIENGSARPSMETLKELAARLGQPVSYFLEEQALVSPNTAVMEAARTAFDAGDFSGTLEKLALCRQPDPVYCREAELLQTLSLLALAVLAVMTLFIDRLNRNSFAFRLKNLISVILCQTAVSG